MIMKALRTFSLVFSLISASLLTGCKSEGKKTDYFKEYSFDTVATSQQISKIQKGIADSLSNVSQIIKKTETYEKSALFENNQSSKTEYRLLEDKTNKDLFVLETVNSSESSSKGNGVSVKQSTKTETKEWDLGTGYRVISTKVSSKNNSEEDSAAYLMEVDSKAYKNTRIQNLVNAPISSSGTFYVKSDGSYICLVSRINKTINTIQYGGSTKDQISSSKSQIAYMISKDYRLTSYYQYEEVSSNRDQKTSEWYDSERLVSYGYYSTEYSYGTRKTASVSELMKAATSKGAIPLSAQLKRYSTTATLSNSRYVIEEPASETSVSISTYSENDDRIRYRFDSYLNQSPSYNNSTCYAERYEFILYSLPADGTPISQSYPIVFDENLITVSSSGIEYLLVTGSLSNRQYIVNLSTSYYLYLAVSFYFVDNAVVIASCTVSN